MKRFLCLLLVLVLVFSCALTVSAEQDGNWFQVLGYSTINDSGSNYFVVNKTATISLKLPSRTYGVWVDMLVNTSDMDITSVDSIWSGSYTPLTVSKISDGLHRVYGRLSYHTYNSLSFCFSIFEFEINCYIALLFRAFAPRPSAAFLAAYLARACSLIRSALFPV